ncbi:SPOR domain-containing protein [Devosia sp. A369]
MTAKTQPMAGQPDAADDLIAELAKLMAEDARPGERPAAAPSFSVRIPGGDDAPKPTPPPRFDFERPAVTPPAAEPPAPRVAETSVRPDPVVETPEPFHFDFDLGGSKPVVAPTPRPTPPAPAAAPVAPPEAQDHDSIADLIAAELSADPHPAAPAPVKPAEPAPVPQPAMSRASSTDFGGQGASPAPIPHPVQPQAAPKAEAAPEQDRFKVAPVFGLATRTAPVAPPVTPVVAEPAPVAPVRAAAPIEPSVASAPAAPLSPDDDLGRDPIDEIENLIGRAMRVEFDKPAAPVAEERPAPSPALRSLATPTIPATPANNAASAARSLSGADEAIMAAAQATGAEIGWVDAPEVDEPAPIAARRQRAPRALGISRAAAGPLVAVTLLLAAGFGLYWVLGLGRDAGPAPLLTADATPSKETPAAPAEAEASQSIVFNEINGVVPGAEEQLVSRDQADVNEVTQTPPTADVSEEGLANRKVRTVTVRPDGTIVSGDDSVAGSTILPVARPNVPEVPGAEPVSPELLATPAPAPAATPAPTPAPAPAATVVPVTPGSTVPAVDLAGNPVAGKTAPVPRLRPSGLVAQAAAPTSPINAVVDSPVSTGNTLPPPPAASQLSAPPAAAIPQAVEVNALPNDAPAYVQLASQRSEAEARASAQAMVNRFGPLFGGANMEVQRVDLGAKGIYYRVRVPANSLQDANTICTNVKAAGGDCFTM